MRVTKEMIVDAQTKELRAIKEEMDRTGDTLADVMDRRPKWIGWIDENGNVQGVTKNGKDIGRI